LKNLSLLVHLGVNAVMVKIGDNKLNIYSPTPVNIQRIVD